MIGAWGKGTRTFYRLTGDNLNFVFKFLDSTRLFLDEFETQSVDDFSSVKFRSTVNLHVATIEFCFYF